MEKVESNDPWGVIGLKGPVGGKRFRRIWERSFRAEYGKDDRPLWAILDQFIDDAPHCYPPIEVPPEFRRAADRLAGCSR